MASQRRRRAEPPPEGAAVFENSTACATRRLRQERCESRPGSTRRLWAAGLANPVKSEARPWVYRALQSSTDLTAFRLDSGTGTLGCRMTRQSFTESLILA